MVSEQVTNGDFETGNFSGWEIGVLPMLDLPIVSESPPNSGNHIAVLKTSAYIKQVFNKPFFQFGDLTFYKWGDLGIEVTVAYSDSTEDKRGGIYLGEHKYVFRVNPEKKVASIQFKAVGGEGFGACLDDVSLRGYDDDDLRPVTRMKPLKRYSGPTIAQRKPPPF